MNASGCGVPRLQRTPTYLVALHGFEQGLEIAFAEALVLFTLDEFEERRGADFKYTPLLGDRAPALDYRK